ncbi:MAG: UDP-glucose dehydrogenase family protein [Gammaproteobacteria bacterium]
MKVSVFGVGYVGLVTGVCLAELGHEVICADIDEKKIHQLQQGKCPIYEPGLDELLQSNMTAGRLKFTTDLSQIVAHGVCLFIAVGTPPLADGSADLRYVLAAAQTIGSSMQEFKVVIVKSTVPVGTCEQVQATINETLAQQGREQAFVVASNPEFLKEGAAIKDFMQPDRIVMGVADEIAKQYLTELYAIFADKLLFTDLASSELSKYAANAMLATRISFMNELSLLAEKVGADIEVVREAIGRDPRIGPYFLRAGCGFGGSCFPKDVRALVQTAHQRGLKMPLLSAVETVNDQQKQILYNKLLEHFGSSLGQQVIAVWGLAFKPNTDDIREASSRVLIETLWKIGVPQVRVYDPVAMPAFHKAYGDRQDLVYADNLYAAAEGADALVIVTEWNEFNTVDWARILRDLRQTVVIDGRNICHLSVMHELPVTYYSIGRSTLNKEKIC